MCNPNEFPYTDCFNLSPSVFVEEPKELATDRVELVPPAGQLKGHELEHCILNVSLFKMSGGCIVCH